MIAYNETFSTFKKHIEDNVIVEEILDKMGQSVGESEQRSFKQSLGEMYKVLNRSNVPLDSRIGIEYKIPITTRRIDFIISGSDGRSDNLVIVELKRWDKVSKTDMPNVVMLAKREYTHPSWQAYSYAATIKHFNQAVDKQSIDIYPTAFLHNYKKEYESEIFDDIYKEAIALAPLYIESDYTKLRTFIETYIKYPSEKDLLYEIEHGKIKPSKMLVDALGSMLNGNDEYILLDEQKVVSDFLYKIATKNQKDDKKHVVIVEGGAGTGKSVIAIDLLGKLITKKAMNAFYVAKSSYVKENYFKKLTRNIPKYSYLKTLFKGSGQFIDANNNDFNCLIVDEAHRLTEKTKKSFMYYGENQIKEIIHASKVSIFFIDPKQTVEIKDKGSIEEIENWADHYGAEIYKGPGLKLKSQFRCSGSDEYIAWVDHLLYGEPFERSDQKVDYDIKVFDDLIEMKEALAKKNMNNKSRMISGDVFPWISRLDKSKIDIVLGDFKAQWNKTKAFATDPKAFDEVGCIHTSQGMEFEYVGLIIGDDLRFVDGKLVADYTRHPDGANEFKRPYQRKINPEDTKKIDQLIRNTYRVLITRGQIGCYIYCMDKKLKKYIEKHLELLT